MKQLVILAFVTILGVGCTQKVEHEHEHRIVVDLKSGNSKPDPWTEGMAPEEVAAAEGDFRLINDTHFRIMAEINATKNTDERVKMLIAFGKSSDQFDKMSKEIGWPKAVKKYRPQIEGKSARDFLAGE
jgi:hypothetical protein